MVACLLMCMEMWLVSSCASDEDVRYVVECIREAMVE